ncbi:hypothetical protein M153_3020004058 [Pseudoloma neurophilia]|uniref:Uncharacterized protein n=1 Tax=Pseudoloma neurophilia TaxID=146866 RepID=A0A0R0M463_9MICR|nr:hypothetical protein M153_3020004058 [Pseudoloma neurophilia]
MSDGKKSADNSQQQNATNILDLSTGRLQQTEYQSKYIFSSILPQNQNFSSSFGLEEQNEPLDLTISSIRNYRILSEPPSTIQKSQSLKRNLPFEKDQVTEPSSSKAVRLENFAHSQEKFQKLSESVNQSAESLKKRQQNTFRHEEQTEEVAGPSTSLENLHLLATCASKQKNYSEQNKVQSVMPVTAENEAPFTLVNILSKYADLVDKSHLTKIKFQNIRKEICDSVSISTLRNMNYCYILKISFNKTEERNILETYKAFFEVHKIESFINETGKITCFGFTITPYKLGVLCTFFVPNTIFNYNQRNRHSKDENSYIGKKEGSHTEITMIVRRPSEINRAFGGNEFLFGIPFQIYRKDLFKKYFIGFHNRQALLFKWCDLSYNQYRFSIQLLDDENCQYLKDST